MTSENGIEKSETLRSSVGVQKDGPLFFLRETRLKDLERILEIYNEAVKNSIATFDIEPQSIESRLEWFREHGERYPLIVAETGGRIAGYCSISKYSKRAGYASTVELSVYVHQDFRRLGIASSLVKEIIARARALRYHVIVSIIASNNFESLELHRKMGFEFCGEIKEMGSKFGKWQDVSFFEMIL